MKNIKYLLRALRYRNYRLFFIGQGISLIGSWMQVIAVGWLTYRMTNSAFLLGVVGFAGQIPIFLLAPFAGVLADNANRRHLLIITQTLSMVQAFVLAILNLTQTLAVWHIISLSILLGLINTFDIPVRHAFLFDMVDNKEDLGNAIALNSSIFNIARLIGPAVAGILIASVGEGPCFLINAVSFMAVIFALMAIRVKPKQIAKKDGTVLDKLAEGFNYAFKHPKIQHILFLVSLVSVMGMSYAVIMPIFAKEILGGGPGTLGFLMGAVGLGALAGAAFLAYRQNMQNIGAVIFTGTIIFSVGLIGFAFSSVLWLSLLLMVCVGFGMMVQMVSSNTALQNLTEDDKRGRVMSLYTVAFMGMTPFGSLLAGTLAHGIGASRTLFISGCFCIIGAFIFAHRMYIFRRRPVLSDPK